MTEPRLKIDQFAIPIVPNRHGCDNLPMPTRFPRRFRLAWLMAAVSLFCVWLSLFRVDVELFVGMGILAALAGAFVYRTWVPAKGVFAINELLAAAFFLCIGFGLVARYFFS